MSAPAVVVVDQGPHHAVLYKPAGMLVVAGRGVPRPTLLDVAIEMFGAGVRPVHRIDRVTSGLCIVAKTPYGQQALSDAFRRHLVDKRYVCVVQGAPTWTKLDVDARLSRQDDPDAQFGKAKGPMAWQTVDPAGVRALTRLRVVARGPDAALVEARPETGRMHQIRCHAAHVGHALLGDAMYGATLSYPEDKAIALCALAVSFPLPQGGRAFVVAEASSAFQKCLSDHGISPRQLDEVASGFRSQGQAHAARAPAKAPTRAPMTKAPKGNPRGRPATHADRSAGPPARPAAGKGSARDARGRPGGRRGR